MLSPQTPLYLKHTHSEGLEAWRLGWIGVIGGRSWWDRRLGGFSLILGARKFAGLWQPVAPCGNGLGALKTRNGAILKGESRDVSTGRLEAGGLEA